MEEVGTPLDKVCFSCDSEEGGGMLFPTWVISILKSWGEVFFDRPRRGWLTWRLTHNLGVGMVLAIGVVTEARMLEGVFTFRGVDVRPGGAIEADGLSLDDFGVRWWMGQCAVGGVML